MSALGGKTKSVVRWQRESNEFSESSRIVQTALKKDSRRFVLIRLIRDEHYQRLF